MAPGSMARIFHSDLSLQHDRVSNNNLDNYIPEEPISYKGKTEVINMESHGSLNPGSSNVMLMPLSSSFGVAPMVGPLMPSTSSYQKKPRNNNATNGSAQLTMFYGGIVSVFDNIPADKAEIIMSLAGSSSCKGKNPLMLNAQAGGSRASPCDDLLQNMKLANMFQVPNDREPQELSSVLAPLKAMVPKALPIARKASLARFLRTRRERIRAGDPYPAGENGEGDRPHGRRQRHLCNEIIGSSFGQADDANASHDLDRENEEYSNDASEHESAC